MDPVPGNVRRNGDQTAQVESKSLEGGKPPREI